MPYSNSFTPCMTARFRWYQSACYRPLDTFASSRSTSEPPLSCSMTPLWRETRRSDYPILPFNDRALSRLTSSSTLSSRSAGIWSRLIF